MFTRMPIDEEEAFIKRMKEENNYQLVKWHSEKRGYVCINAFAFTTGIMYGLNESGYFGRWCYPRQFFEVAVIALDLWDGEGDPKGPWVKYKGQDGERSNTNEE